MKDLIREESPDHSEACHFATPLAMIAPTAQLTPLGGGERGDSLPQEEDMLFDSQKSLVLSQEKEQTDLAPVLSPGKLKVHGADGVYFMDEAKWPKLKEAITEQDLLNQLQQGHDEPAEGAVSNSWEPSPVKKKKGRTTKSKVAISSRASTRIPRDGIPIAEKAMRRAQDKDNFTSGNTKNPFAVLNNTPNEVLGIVISDLDIMFENIDPVINAFKIEELARAELAQANYKLHLEKINKKTTPQGEEELQDLSMKAINNSLRLDKNSTPHAQCCEGLISINFQ